MEWLLRGVVLALFWLPLLAAGLVLLLALVPMAAWRRLADWWRPRR